MLLLYSNYYKYYCVCLLALGHVFAAEVKPELKDLLKELYNKAGDLWEDIGILLGIDTGTLDAIKASQNHRSQNCLREMLKVWLKRAEPPPSWSAITEAVESLGDESLANSLRTKYHVLPSTSS